MTKPASNTTDQDALAPQGEVVRDVDSGELAKRWELHARTLQNWAKAGCPHEKGPRRTTLFNEEEAREWAIENGKKLPLEEEAKKRPLFRARGEEGVAVERPASIGDQIQRAMDDVNEMIVHISAEIKEAQTPDSVKKYTSSLSDVHRLLEKLDERFAKWRDSDESMLRADQVDALLAELAGRLQSQMRMCAPNASMRLRVGLSKSPIDPKSQPQAFDRFCTTVVREVVEEGLRSVADEIEDATLTPQAPASDEGEVAA